MEMLFQAHQNFYIINASIPCIIHYWLLPSIFLTLFTSLAIIESLSLLKCFLTYVSTSAMSSFLKKLCCGITLLYCLPFTVIGLSKPFNTTSINFFLSPFTHSELSKG